MPPLKSNAALTSETTPTSPDTVEAQGTLNGVTLTARLPKESVAGQPVILQLSITNTTDKVVAGVTTMDFYNHWGILVQDEKQQPVPRTRFGVQHVYLVPPLETGTGNYGAIPVKPGETVSTSFNLARLYDLTVEGRYTLTAQIIMATRTHDFVVKTAPVSFQMDEK